MANPFYGVVRWVTERWRFIGGGTGVCGLLPCTLPWVRAHSSVWCTMSNLWLGADAGMGQLDASLVMDI